MSTRRATVRENALATVQAFAGLAFVAVVLWPRTWPLVAYVLVGCFVLDRAARSLQV